ncbi:hypothetical protein GQR58_014942 [Nymphon striatum]|nr:hypothetical protein GQR58_014942 [Nymphon striatum]
MASQIEISQRQHLEGNRYVQQLEETRTSPGIWHHTLAKKLMCLLVGGLSNLRESNNQLSSQAFHGRGSIATVSPKVEVSLFFFADQLLDMISSYISSQDETY